MPRLSPNALEAASARLLGAAGTAPDVSARVAAILVRADCVGHGTHGVARLPGYLEEIAAKRIDPQARPTVVHEQAATALVDGGNGWGHFAAYSAMEIAIAKARAAGLGAVALKRATHIGRVGEYVELAAREDCIGLVMLGYGGKGLGWSAPFGGRDRMLMTNPIAIGAPTADGPPFVLDFATTTASRGKIEAAQREGRAIPLGWVLDEHGQPTTNPADLAANGLLTLLGDHKGYALSLATCLLGGLTGAFNAEHSRLGGTFMLAIDVKAFLPRDAYRTAAGSFLAAMRASRPVDAGRPVQVPGDMEAGSAATAATAGVDLPDATWAQLLVAFGRHGVAPPPILGVEARAAARA